MAYISLVTAFEDHEEHKEHVNQKQLVSQFNFTQKELISRIAHIKNSLLK